MPTAPVDDKGSVLYYEDSGEPAGSHRLCDVRAHTWNVLSQRPMVPFALERNIRLIMLNMRGYPGSTPLSAEDIADLRDRGEEGQARAMQNRGLEIAAFLRWLIKTKNIRATQELAGARERGGGLSLLSWSGGNCPTIAMLAHADRLSKETRTLLETRLRSFIMHDPSGSVIGQPRPPGLSAFTRNPAAPVDVQAAEFAAIVAAYYPPFTFPKRVDPPPTFDPPRRALHLTDPSTVDPKHTPTTSRMTAEVLRSLTHPQIFTEIQHLIWMLSRNVLRTNLSRALYDCCLLVESDDHQKDLAAVQVRTQVWPALRVHVLWCDMTVGDCAWTAAVIQAQYEAARPECRRRMQFHKVTGANHFVHWEEPERFVELLASIV